MRVLHLISDANRRGAQVFADQLRAELAAYKIRGPLVALKPAEGATAVAATLAAPGLRNLRRQLAGYEVVIAHGSTTLDVAAALAPGRFIYRSIGDPRFWIDRPRRRLKTKVTLARAKAVVALYDDAAEALHELADVPRQRLSVIPNAVRVDTETARQVDRRELGIDPLARIVLYVGSLTWEKRVHLLIDAVAGVAGAHLLVVGSGPLASDVDRYGSAQLAQRWHRIESVADPRPFYAAADVLALASITEGQPGTILEAAAFGLPVVAPAVGGIPDLLVQFSVASLVHGDAAVDYRDAIGATLSAGRNAPADVSAGFAAVTESWASLISAARGTTGFDREQHPIPENRLQPPTR